MAETLPTSRAPWLTWPETRAVIAALEAVRPGGARFVGGCVRNAVLGATVDDIDIATTLLPEEVMACARAAGLAAAPTGIEHGTVTVIAQHKPFEVTTLRRDVETDGRRAVVAFTTDWNEDAARRDFRMNALYASPTGEIFDPTGGGLDDARQGRVTFIGDPDMRLREDYLRVLRFFRFHAWYGRGAIDTEGVEACARARGGLEQLSAERVWKETKKLLSAATPQEALAAMEACGVRQALWPEAGAAARLMRLIDIEDEFLFPPDPLLRCAAMLNDGPSAVRFALRMKVSRDEKDRLEAALGTEPRLVSYMSLREMRRAVYAIGAQAFRDRALIAHAGESHNRTRVQWRALVPLAETWTAPKMPLTGEDVMAAGAPPGPLVGEILREVEAWWIDSDFPDDKLALIERLKAVAQALV